MLRSSLCKHISVCNISCMFGPAMFLMYPLRDVIFAERCSVSVMSTTCVKQHAVVRWVIAVGIRAIASTLGWKPSKGIEPVGYGATAKNALKA